MLSLQNVKITNTTELQSHIEITSESDVIDRTCQHCSSINTVLIGSAVRTYPHSTIDGMPVKIFFSRKRLKCKACSKTFFEGLSFVDEQFLMTKSCVRQIINRTRKSPFLQVAEELGIDEKTVRSVYSVYVMSRHAHVKHVSPIILGMDEAHLNKQMRLVLTDVLNKKIIDIYPDRSKKSVIRAINRLDSLYRIAIVTIDMWRPYRDAVKSALPKAIIVVDRFHVAKYANEAMDNARKKTRSVTTTKERIKLKSDRKILFKRRKDITGLNEIASFEFWTNEYPDLMSVYNAKEAFLDMWEMPDAPSARDYWENWLSVTPDHIKSKYFSRLITSMENWADEIFNWWTYPVTNAVTESLNNIIKLIYKNGRGYSFDVLRTKILEMKGVDSKPDVAFHSFGSGKLVIFDREAKGGLTHENGISVSPHTVVFVGVKEYQSAYRQRPGRAGRLTKQTPFTHE